MGLIVHLVEWLQRPGGGRQVRNNCTAIFNTEMEPWRRTRTWLSPKGCGFALTVSAGQDVMRCEPNSIWMCFSLQNTTQICPSVVDSLTGKVGQSFQAVSPSDIRYIFSPCHTRGMLAGVGPTYGAQCFVWIARAHFQDQQQNLCWVVAKTGC